MYFSIHNINKSSEQNPHKNRQKAFKMESIKEFKDLCSKDSTSCCGFIGSGNMATAIIKGIIKSELFEPNQIFASATRPESLEKLKSLKVNTTLDNRELFDKCRIIFLCVKPNGVKSVADGLGISNADYSHKTLVSILAGTTIESLKQAFSGCFQGMNYIRAMPNTPLMVCAGATAVTKDETSSKDSKLNFQVILKIFQSCGIVEVVDETKLHAITGVSGSGPAYIYIIIEALSDAGVKAGLPRDLATKFAAQTVFGASKTILETGLHPGQAKDQVTSPGGTTIHAVHELEKGRIRDTLINAVEAAAKRSEELGKK